MGGLMSDVLSISRIEFKSLTTRLLRLERLLRFNGYVYGVSGEGIKSAERGLKVIVYTDNTLVNPARAVRPVDSRQVRDVLDALVRLALVTEADVEEHLEPIRSRTKQRRMREAAVCVYRESKEMGVTLPSEFVVELCVKGGYASEKALRAAAELEDDE